MGGSETSWDALEGNLDKKELAMKKRKKLIAILLAALSVFSAGCFWEKDMSSGENKIQLNAHAGGEIDCTPLVYQDYLGLTDEDFAAIERLMLE